MTGETQTATPNRSRALAAGGLAVGLLVAVVVLASGGGSEEKAVAAADPECLEAWNSDSAAQGLGRHQAGFHRYTSVQVLRLKLDGPSVASDPAGNCAVAYAAAIPAEELNASVHVLEGDQWIGLDSVDGVTPALLAELQREAIDEVNAGIDGQGRLVAY